MPVGKTFRPVAVEPALPPRREVDEKRWHYHPCPQLISDFHMDEAFITQMFEPQHAHPKDDPWLELSPKKLNDKFRYKQNDTGMAWGIRIEEDLNPVAIAWIGLLISLLSGMIGVIYSLVTSDVGAAFTIAAWIAGNAALAVLYLQASLRQS